MDRLVFHVDKSKYVRMLLGCAAFVAIGVWLATSEGEWFGWVGAVFFGACAGVAVWQMSQSAPRLIIDDDGLLDRTLGVGVIEWNDVLDARPLVVAKQPLVGLTLRDPEVYLSRLGTVKRKIVGANSSMGFDELSLNLSGLRDADPVEIADLVAAQAASRRAL